MDIQFLQWENLGEKPFLNITKYTYPAFLIKQVQYPKLGLYQINAWLVVIEIYEFPLYFFL
jgi:hypothetical protein